MLFACKLVSYLNDKIMHAIDKKYEFISISNVIWMVALFFLILVLYDFALNANPGAVSKTSALIFAILCVACFMIAGDFFKWLFCKMFDLPNYAADMGGAVMNEINSLSRLF